MKVAWQSYVVHIIAISGIFLTLIAGNMSQLAITNPWLTIVVIPGLVGAHIYASNQLKAINSPPPGVPLTEATAKPADRSSTPIPPQP